VFGGGIVSLDDTLHLENCILWGNTGSPGSQILIADAHVSIDYCDIEFGEDSVYNFASSILIWGSGNIDIDPMFETGPLCDYHLSLSSPCIDAGNPAFEYNDPEDPLNPGYALWPAMGYLRNDMGAFGGSGIDYWLSVEEEEISFAESSLPLHVFPNPFSSTCSVCFQLEKASQVYLSVFDLSGRLVQTLADEHVPSGQHSEQFDASDLCPGVYLIRIVAGDASASQRCVVVR
jgi:hypothetical protein